MEKYSELQVKIGDQIMIPLGIKVRRHGGIIMAIKSHDDKWRSSVIIQVIQFMFYISIWNKFLCLPLEPYLFAC